MQHVELRWMLNEARPRVSANDSSGVVCPWRRPEVNHPDIRKKNCEKFLLLIFHVFHKVQGGYSINWQ